MVSGTSAALATARGFPLSCEEREGGEAGRRDSKQAHDEEGALASWAADRLPNDNFTIALSMRTYLQRNN